MKSWTVNDWDQEAIDAATTAEWAIVRNLRNQKLSETDWTQVADSPVDQILWATYRQELRDITLQSDPFNIIWPTKP